MSDEPDISELVETVAALQSRIDNLESELLTKADDFPEGDIVVNEEEAAVGDSFDTSKFAFGFTISGVVVTVKAGDVYHGKRTNYYNVPDTNVTITADYQYIWVEYPFGQGYAQIAGPSTVKPATDATTFRCWLHQFRKQAGVVTLHRIGHLGNIEIPGVYA